MNWKSETVNGWSTSGSQIVLVERMPRELENPHVGPSELRLM
uniref:Uncharacterized protein n=1 Tax=Picea glauca TaxID=3330 RepID=A0A117NHQ1_PICGL|nr:hypothetical protein ABT39_MTgene4743 [Picea glauca]QHR89607.1 hypothetical protein Q903MT_gene3629 [Picea sitchensis]